jgi:hypothetical protein
MKNPSISTVAKLVAERFRSRESFHVSKVSYWYDFVWHLDTSTPGQRVYLGWDFPLPDGTRSTSPEHSVLLESFREVAWGMLTDGGSYGKSLKTGTAASLGVGIRELFRWMVHCGLADFSELIKVAQAEYLSDIPVILANRSKFYLSATSYSDDDFEEDYTDADGFSKIAKTEDLAEDDTFSYSQVLCRVNTMYYIFHQKENLKSARLPVLNVTPFSGSSAFDITCRVAKHTINRIPPLPDEVALPLLKEVQSWINIKAEDVLRLQSMYFDAKIKGENQGLSKDAVLARTNLAIRNFTFSVLPSQNEPWRVSISADEVILHPQRGAISLDATQMLRMYIMRARDSAIHTLQYMVGMRVSEICSTKGGWANESDLPDCIVRRFSKNGVMELFFVKGVLTKGVPQPRDDEWLLGCRPVGSLEYPAPVKAIMLLERLFRPWRELGGKGGLIVSFAQPRGLPQVSKSVSEITSSALLKGAKRFVFSEVDLSHLPDSNEHDENLAMYRDSKGLCIRTHQGRKTFAAYMLESRTSLLRAVSQHFKHMNVAVTESAYFPAISRLRGDAESISFAETVSFFAEATQGKKIYGRMGEVVMEYFGKQNWKNCKTLGELERKVSELVKTHDLRIFFTQYGACLIKANPVESACRNATGRASWQLDTPDYSARSLNICSGCACYAMDSTHLPFWKSRASSLEIIVEQATKVGNAREFRVHKSRLEQAKKVVQFFTKVNSTTSAADTGLSSNE